MHRFWLSQDTPPRIPGRAAILTLGLLGVSLALLVGRTLDGHAIASGSPISVYQDQEEPLPVASANAVRVGDGRGEPLHHPASSAGVDRARTSGPSAGAPPCAGLSLIW